MEMKVMRNFRRLMKPQMMTMIAAKMVIQRVTTMTRTMMAKIKGQVLYLLLA